MENFLVHTVLPLGVYLVIGAAAFAVISAVVGASNDPKGSLKSLIGMGLVAGLLFIAFSMASPDNPSKEEVTGNIAKWVEGGLLSVVIMITITFVLMIASMIKEAFN